MFVLSEKIACLTFFVLNGAKPRYRRMDAHRPESGLRINSVRTTLGNISAINNMEFMVKTSILFFKQCLCIRGLKKYIHIFVMHLVQRLGIKEASINFLHLL